jgi:orotate phosphoribosyltransferase
LSAIQEVQRDYGIDVFSIIDMQDLIDYLSSDEDSAQQLDAMLAYRSKYGI